MSTLTAPIAADVAQLIEKYDGRAPRYTSYPTAVQFTPQVGADIYRDWLSRLPCNDAVSLYLHIPFCARMCWYCGCNTRAVNSNAPISDYVGILLAEMATLATALPGRLKTSAIHLGGGTPNMLKPREMSAVFDGLRRTFEFTDDCEIAAELDPAVLTKDWVRDAAAHGLTRASLGIQNLDPKVQAAINRKESVAEIAACVGWLRTAGVRSINLDLMYGLPHQTTHNTLATVEAILALRPERVALFGYAHVPWMKSHQQLIHEDSLPGPAERLEQSESAAERLVSEGYVRIGLDHFAMPTDDLAVATRTGGLHRNFQGYTTDTAGTLLGLGASAIGALPQGFVQNVTQELAWRRAVIAGDLPVARGVVLTDDDRLRGAIIERLMCDLKVDVAALCTAHGRTVFDLAPEFAVLEGFERDGLVHQDGHGISVTERGRLLVRSVCAVFDQHLEPGSQRHSKTI